MMCFLAIWYSEHQDWQAFKTSLEEQIIVMTLSFRTDRSGQTVQILEEQSDQGLHCLLFHLYHFDKIPFRVWPLFEFKVDYSKVIWRPEIKELYGKMCITYF